MTQKHHYKLVYFDTKGRAEPIRLLFNYFDVDFEDVRLKKEEDYKNGSPFGQLPYLDVDRGKHVISQTSAILRYVAKSFQAGFAGKTRIDAAKCDMFNDTFWDVLYAYWSEKLAPTPEMAEEMRMKWLQIRPEKLEIFQKYLRKNGGRYMVGDELTYTDLCFLYFLYVIQRGDGSGALDDFPLLTEYYNRILRLPQITEYVLREWNIDEEKNRHSD
ncbi:unnamed protein product, partial [Mesorhabditis belari]|uniref:Glutathione S-transferase n=1 Tax=Mesorhabditis belari TaxID=2138241 RepID=A0AAF3F0S4_9BILA